jgi:NodT family efflux transporter outer membrane factor (OMF) lipoprotein
VQARHVPCDGEPEARPHVWESDLWGKLRHRRDAAQAQYLASVERTNLVLTALVADVAAGYFELLALDHTRAILLQAVARQEQAVEVVRLQKEAGRANELAVQQFDAQLAETRALEREAARAAGEAENRLNVLLGRYPQAIQRESGALLAAPARLAAGLPADLLHNRPDVRAAELQVRAARFDVQAARAAFFPSLELNAGVGLAAFNPAYLVKVPASLTYGVGGGLVAPLVNRRALEAQFAGARAQQIEALHAYQRAILVAYVEVVNGLADVHHADGLLALKQAQKDTLTQAVGTADILYRAGKATYLEVLMAQQGALRAELDLVAAWKRRRVGDVILYKALGGGWR